MLQYFFVNIVADGYGQDAYCIYKLAILVLSFLPS